MAIIKVENLTFSYPSSGEEIFENVNFRIDTDWKLGFMGAKRQRQNHVSESFARQV